LEDPSKLAVRICNRYYGVGADGIILVLPSKVADFKMSIYNPDGSEAEMCGNGIRGLGKYLFENNLTHKTELKIETLCGIKTLKMNIQNDKVENITVNMGKPGLLYTDKGEDALKVITDIPLKIENEIIHYTPVSMGNPHAVIIVNNLELLDIKKYGPLIEKNPKFPHRTNVEFVQVIDPKNIKMRVWERGVGETLACGTGASASVVATYLLGLTTNNVNVHLKGGKLKINWVNNECVYLNGKAEHVFNGKYDCSYV
jgi:diaminopimelate epimerase